MMEKKGKVLLALLVMVLSVTFQGCSNQQNKMMQTTSSADSAVNLDDSSVVFRVLGNVYPQGLYYVVLHIGNPRKEYHLDIDSGSDLTWLECAPCVSCSKAPHPLYQPHDFVIFEDPICASLQSSRQHECNNPDGRCDYSIQYVDGSSSRGNLVRDVFSLSSTNGNLLEPRLAFGCGYEQEGFNAGPLPPMDGVLGLGSGKSSITSQLRDQGLIRNVIGHCFSQQDGGFLFFGSNVVPSSGVVWTPVSHNSLKPPLPSWLTPYLPSIILRLLHGIIGSFIDYISNYYSPGLAELIVGGQPTGVNDLLAVFDSGSTYTYFNSKAYKALISVMKKDLERMPLRETSDQDLPLCWGGAEPFKSVSDATQYFQPVILSFSNGKKAQLEISPESYLIITSEGNACLGILNGTEVGLNVNLIGDTAMRDKMVIYDYDKHQIGWVPADCDELLKSGTVI